MKKHVDINAVKKARIVSELTTSEEKLVNGGIASMAVMYGVLIPYAVLIELGLIIAQL